jgi:hypothetical protein
MTHFWQDWMSGEEDRRSCSYDFIEARPVWKTRVFLLGVTAACVSGLLIFWTFR